MIVPELGGAKGWNYAGELFFCSGMGGEEGRIFRRIRCINLCTYTYFIRWDRQTPIAVPGLNGLINLFPNGPCGPWGNRF